VKKGYDSPRSPAALLEGLFEHPAKSFSPSETIEQLAFNSGQISSTTC
jgi:hypothetical protein